MFFVFTACNTLTDIDPATAARNFRTITIDVNGVVRILYVPIDASGEFPPHGPSVPPVAQTSQTAVVPQSNTHTWRAILNQPIIPQRLPSNVLAPGGMRTPLGVSRNRIPYNQTQSQVQTTDTEQPSITLFSSPLVTGTNTSNMQQSFQQTVSLPPVPLTMPPQPSNVTSFGGSIAPASAVVTRSTLALGNIQGVGIPPRVSTPLINGNGLAPQRVPTNPPNPLQHLLFLPSQPAIAVPSAIPSVQQKSLSGKKATRRRNTRSRDLGNKLRDSEPLLTLALDEAAASQKQFRKQLWQHQSRDVRAFCKNNIKEIMASLQLCTVDLNKIDMKGKETVNFAYALSQLYPNIFEH